MKKPKFQLTSVVGEEGSVPSIAARKRACINDDVRLRFEIGTGVSAFTQFLTITIVKKIGIRYLGKVKRNPYNHLTAVIKKGQLVEFLPKHIWNITPKY